MTEKTEGKKRSAKTAVKAAAGAIKSGVHHVVPKKQTNANTLSSNRLELLVTVVERSKGEFYADIIQSFEVNMQMVVFGQGTADKKMLSYLGLTNSDKAIIFSVIQEAKLKEACIALEEKFATIKNGKGIAFSISLTSVIGTLIYGFLSNNKMAVKEEKGA